MNLKTILEITAECLTEAALTEAPAKCAEEERARELYVAFIKALAGDPPAGFPETRRLAIVSSVHMSEEDNKYASRHAFHGEPLIVAVGPHSTILRLPDEENTKPDWMSYGLWSNLLALAAQGFERVEFDGDAPIIPTLIQHDW